MILSTCPNESDPREKVSAFVSDTGMTALSGLKSDGLKFLYDLVIAEIEKQEPDSEIVYLDREFLSDNNVIFDRDLNAALLNVVSRGKRINWIVYQDVPVVGWASSLDILKGKNSQAYFFTTACRQIPCCFKLIER